MIASVAALLVVGGAGAYYFGYKVNPSVIYSQSLSNTGKGYDKLISYVDEQSRQKNQDYTGSGSYSVKVADFPVNGKLDYKFNGSDDQLTFDVDYGVGQVEADLRSFKSSDTASDIYIKADGLNTVGQLIGAPPEMTGALDKLDGQWIVIDHSLIENLGSSAFLGAAAGLGATQAGSQPSRAELLDEARAFGKVNQEYVFTTDKDKAVTKVVKKHGMEDVGGHKTYHYTVALQKDHVKKYITAQRDALKASQLGDWLEKNDYDTAVYEAFDDARDSADDIKASETFDVWMDVDQRIVYKVRPDTDNKNTATEFIDIGLNYKGGDSYPFFISGQDKLDGETINYSFVTTLNTKTKVTDFKLNVKASGQDGGSLTADFTYRPSSTPVKIDKPVGAKPLADVLNELGYGDIYNQYVQSLTAPAAVPDDSGLMEQ